MRIASYFLGVNEIYPSLKDSYIHHYEAMFRGFQIKSTLNQLSHITTLNVAKVVGIIVLSISEIENSTV